MLFPKIPLGEYVAVAVDWAQINLDALFSVITSVIEFVVTGIQIILSMAHPLLLTAIVFALVWFISRKTAVGTVVGLLLIYNLELWEPAVETLSLVLAATILALLAGIPMGILSARIDLVNRVVAPVLDFMQTMPPFVYLIPAVLFFGLGQVPGLIATVVFAMPPSIRLTALGIRQVPPDLVEAADAFGSTEWQKLVKVQLPLALPTIMAGINQSIMLSLSMVVISAMIGAGGLGSEVLAGISRLDIAKGFEGGLAIVVIAIILDRITQGLTNKRSEY